MITKRQRKTEIDGADYLLYQFPLEKSATGFEILTRKIGEPIIELLSSFLLKFKKETMGENIILALQKSLKKDDFSALKDVIKNLKDGEMYEFIKFFVAEPDYIKYKGKAINIKEVHEAHGLMHLWALAFEVIKFHYFDFLSQGGEMPPSSKESN